MRLLADANIDRNLVERLHADGHDVTCGALHDDADEQLLYQATSERRIILTEDRDFGELAVARGLASIGIIYLRLADLSRGSAIERAAGAISELSEYAAGAITTIEPARIRRRAL